MDLSVRFRGVKFLAVLLLAILISLCCMADEWIIYQESVVIDTPTVHEGDIIVAAGGELTVTAELTLHGTLLAVDDGIVVFDSTRFRLMNLYNHHNIVVAMGHATVSFANMEVSSNGFQAGLIMLEDASMTIRGSNFLLEPSGVIQPSMYGRGRIEITDSLGFFEVIITDEGDFIARRVPPAPEYLPYTYLWVWPYFNEGTKATLTYPAVGLQDYEFPGPDDEVGFSCLLDDVNVPFWPLLARPDTEIHLLSNGADRGVIVGLLLPNDASITLQNGSYHADELLSLEDRILRLTETTVQTWNLYPEGNASVRVSDSVLGEILAMGESGTHVKGSVIDGSGGFLGVRDGADLTLVNSRITTVIENTGSGTLALFNTEIEDHPEGIPSTLTSAGEGVTWLHNSDRPQSLLANDGAVILETSISREGDSLELVFDVTAAGETHPTISSLLVIVQDPYSQQRSILLESATVDENTITLSLPSFCLAPCDCLVTVRFYLEDQSYLVREEVCSSETGHRPPVKGP